MASPCPDCHALVAPYDTTPWRGEWTAAYECKCGSVWTLDLKEKR